MAAHVDRTNAALQPDDIEFLEDVRETLASIKRSCAYLEQAMVNRLERERPLPRRGSLAVIQGGRDG
jgi:hypothetical protein